MFIIMQEKLPESHDGSHGHVPLPPSSFQLFFFHRGSHFYEKRPAAVNRGCRNQWRSMCNKEGFPSVSKGTENTPGFPKALERFTNKKKKLHEKKIVALLWFTVCLLLQTPAVSPVCQLFICKIQFPNT